MSRETMSGVVARLMAQHSEAVARAEKAERERDEALAKYAEAARENATGLVAFIERGEALQQAREDMAVERHLRKSAERARDEARERCKAEITKALAAEDRAERAEADNAALLGLISEWMRELERANYPSGHPVEHASRAMASTVDADHPGAALLERLKATEQELETFWASVLAEPSGAERIHAALAAAGIPEEDEVSGVLGLEEHVGRALERLRALEKVTEAVRPFVKACIWPEPWPNKAESEALVNAVNAADALKEKA